MKLTQENLNALSDYQLAGLLSLLNLKQRGEGSHSLLKRPEKEALILKPISERSPHGTIADHLYQAAATRPKKEVADKLRQRANRIAASTIRPTVLDRQTHSDYDEPSDIDKEDGSLTTHHPLYDTHHLDEPRSPPEPQRSGDQLQTDDGRPDGGNDGWHTPRSSTHASEPSSPKDPLPLANTFSALAPEDEMEVDTARGTKRRAASLSPTRSPQGDTTETKTTTPLPLATPFFPSQDKTDFGKSLEKMACSKLVAECHKLDLPAKDDDARATLFNRLMTAHDASTTTGQRESKKL